MGRGYLTWLSQVPRPLENARRKAVSRMMRGDFSLEFRLSCRIRASLILAAALAATVATALGACTAETHDGPVKPQPAPATESGAPASGPVGSNPDAASLYTKYCALCHAADATGYAADNAPSLVSETFLATASDTFLHEGISRGRPGTAMAGYAKFTGGPLEPGEISALIAYLRALKPTPRLDLPKRLDTGDVRRGQAVYHRDCASCHGTQAQRGNAVHLANPVFLQDADAPFLHYAIVHGRPGTPMVAFGSTLTGQAIDDVVAYLKSLSLTGTLQPPMSPNTTPVVVPAWTPLPTNPKGTSAKFTLRADRFAPMPQVKSAFDGNKRLILLDARAPSDFVSLHIEGAVSLPYYDLKLIDKLEPFKRDGTWIIAYCGCPHHASGVVVDELRKRGFKNSAVLDEGLFAWQRAGYPTVGQPGMKGIAAPPP